MNKRKERLVWHKVLNTPFEVGDWLAFDAPSEYANIQQEGVHVSYGDKRKELIIIPFKKFIVEIVRVRRVPAAIPSYPSDICYEVRWIADKRKASDENLYTWFHKFVKLVK
jgi:hypothetical protein